MAINLGAAYVDIVPSTANLAKETRQQLEGPLEDSGRRAGQGFGSRFSSAVSSLAGNIGRTLVSTIEGAAVTAGGLLSASLFKGYSRVTTIQDATAALTISLGDAAKAAGLLDNVLNVVRGTPFNLDQFAAAAQQLVGFGVEAEKVPGYLTAIGEASATQGRRANEFADRLATVFGQIAASGQVSLADVWRISDAGVNALAILANSFGVTRDAMKDMISAGAVPAGEALDALAKGILEGTDGPAGATVALAGTMASLRTTLTGAAGGFSAAMARLGAAIITPLTGALTTGFTSAGEILDTFGARFGKWVEGITQSAGFAAFVELLEELPDKVSRALGAVSDTLGPGLAPLAAGFGAMGLSGLSGLIPVIGGLIPQINPLVAALAGLVAVSPELRDVFLATMQELAPVLASVGAVLAEGLRDVLPQITPALAEIADAFGRILIAVAPALPMLAQLAVVLVDTIGPPVLAAIGAALQVVAGALEALGPVLPIVVAGVIAFKVAFAGLTAVMAANPLVLLAGALVAVAAGLVWAYQNVGWFRDAVDAVLGVVGTAAGLVVDLAGAFWDAGAAVGRFFKGLPGIVKGAVSGVLSAGKAVVDFFRRLPGMIVEGLANLGSLLINLFVTAIKNLPMAIGFAIGAVVAAIVGIPFLVLQGLWALGNWLWDEWLYPAIKALPGLLATGFTAVIDFFANLPGNIVDAVGAFGQFVWNNVFVPAFNFIVTELPRGVAKILSWFTELPGKIVSAIGNVAMTLWSKGWDLLNGLWDGAVKLWEELRDWVSELPGKILDALGDVSKILFDAGKKILGGLWDGMKAGWNSMTGWIGGLAGEITSLKGPLDYDARLLIPAGTAIMGGLLDGMQSRWGQVAGWLSGLGEEIPDTFTAHGSLAVAAAPAPAASLVIDVRGGDAELVRLVQKWVRTNGGGDVQVLAGR